MTGLPFDVLEAQVGDVYYNLTDVVIPRWLMTVVAYLFFLFFGVSEDIIGEYLRYGRRIRGFIRRRSATSPPNRELPPRPCLETWTDCLRLSVSFKLGSSVANPAGSKWSRDHDRDDLDDYKSAAISPDIPPRTGFSGITVKVERETV